MLKKENISVFLVNFLFFCKILQKNSNKSNFYKKNTFFSKNEYNTDASDAMLYCVGCVIKKKKNKKKF